MKEILFNEVELDRLLTLNHVRSRSLTQVEAGLQLGISERQVRRLLKQMAVEGCLGIKAKHKGGNRTFPAGFKTQVLNTVIEFYPDYGPTLASEKLESRNGLKVNKETLRQWMVESGLWQGRIRKQARIHQGRERRSRFGELIQIDGSHHDWFEGRSPKCCLLVFIDDATSKLIGLRFDKSETTLAYMSLIEHHLITYGRPISYYSDKHSIFKTTREQSLDRRLQDTQVHRALRELRIELICAHSSQAKGRVERANKTLQDRLIKEMRLREISTIEEANLFLPDFILEYNQRFSIEAMSSEDAHRPVHHDLAGLKRILSVQSTRKLTKNLEFSFFGKIYQIKTKTTGYRLRHKTIKVCEQSDGTLEILCDNEPLEYVVLGQSEHVKMADCKEINGIIDEIIAASDLGFLAALPTGPTAPAQLSY